MAEPSHPKDPALRDVFWRQEVVELVLWLRGEGFDDHLDADTLSRFLGLEVGEARRQLRRLTAAGYLARRPDGRYRLSERGEREGERIVQAAAPVPEPRRGQCGPICWCHASRAEAATCADERAARR